MGRLSRSTNQYNIDNEAGCILGHGVSSVHKVILNTRINKMANEFSGISLQFLWSF